MKKVLLINTIAKKKVRRRKYFVIPFATIFQTVKERRKSDAKAEMKDKSMPTMSTSDKGKVFVF